MLLLSIETPETETEDLRRLWKEQDEIPGEIWLSFGPGRLTVFPHGSISDIEVKTYGDRADGSFRFRREHAMKGRVEFSAKRTGERWRILEFRIPAAAARTTLAADGAWKPSWE